MLLIRSPKVLISTSCEHVVDNLLHRVVSDW